MQPVKLFEDYRSFILLLIGVPDAPFIDNALEKPLQQRQYRVSAYHFSFFSLCMSPCFTLLFFFLSFFSAASSFSFCRASLEHTVSAEELSYQLPRRAGGSNLTWHDGRGQKTAHTRTVKLLQQPGTEGIQV